MPNHKQGDYGVHATKAQEEIEQNQWRTTQTNHRKKVCYSTGQTLVSLVFPCRRLFCGHYCAHADTYDCKLKKTTGFFVSGG